MCKIMIAQERRKREKNIKDKKIKRKEIDRSWHARKLSRQPT